MGHARYAPGKAVCWRGSKELWYCSNFTYLEEGDSSCDGCKFHNPVSRIDDYPPPCPLNTNNNPLEYTIVLGHQKKYLDIDCEQIKELVAKEASFEEIEMVIFALRKEGEYVENG